MNTIGLGLFDWLIIGVYFAFVLGIGFYLRRFTTSEEDYFLAGRRNSSWVAGLSFLSANLGALELMGMAGNTFLGWNRDLCMWAAALTVALYVGLSGLMSAIFSEIIRTTASSTATRLCRCSSPATTRPGCWAGRDRAAGRIHGRPSGQHQRLQHGMVSGAIFLLADRCAGHE